MIMTETRILNVCTFCENPIIGAADPDATPISQPQMCKVHLAQALNPEPHPYWPIMHPDGWCDSGGQCRIQIPDPFAEHHPPEAA